MLRYRNVLLAQTGICSGIHPMALEYTTSVISFTVTVRTYPNHKPWITGNIRIELKARAAAFKERDTNPAMPSDEPSNKQTVNTGLRFNPTTPSLMLVGCGRA